MKKRIFIFFNFLVIFNLFSFHTFIASRENLADFVFLDSDIICASSGRSGSTMLTSFLFENFPNRNVFKTHLLPIENFPGKVIFIFSNPHQAAQSALHQFVLDKKFSYLHIRNMESSLREWHLDCDDDSNDRIVNNLLGLDLIGYGNQIYKWVYELDSTTIENAKVMAIKYENLWDEETLINLATFLGVDSLQLPEKKNRGEFLDRLTPKELELICIYNQGTKENPRYKAYDFAFDLWRKAPPFSFHTLKKSN